MRNKIGLIAILAIGLAVTSATCQARDIGHERTAKEERTSDKVMWAPQPVTAEFVITPGAVLPPDGCVLIEDGKATHTNDATGATAMHAKKTTSTAVGRTIARRLLNGVISLACYKFISDSITGLHADLGLNC